MKKKISISVIILVFLALLGIVVYKNYTMEPVDEKHLIKEVAMPTYAKNEIINAEKRIKEISSNRSISFSYLTDLHGDKEIFAPISNIQAFKQIGNNKLIEFGVCAGDITTGAYEDFQSGKALTNLEYFSKEFSDTETQTLFARGNHDCNTRKDASVAISGQQYYETVLKRLSGNVVFNPEDLGGNYYYKDLEDKKIRICVLNAFNGANYEFIFGDKQLEFVQNEMLDLSDKQNPNEWQILFISHTVDETPAHGEIPSDNEKLYNIINKFQEDGGTVIAIITGHHHMDTTMIKNNLLLITVRSASVIFDRLEYNTENFSEEDLCFDIFTIDKDTKTLYATRVGRGNDRKWSYDTNNLNEEQITREKEDVLELSGEDSIKVDTITNYNGQVIAIVTSNKEFKEKTNPTWKLSKDKKTYTKILDDVEFPYTTTFTNINGYSITHKFEGQEEKNEEIAKLSVKQEKIKQENLINIKQCSEEFMEEYFEEIKEINDRENVLILTSKEKIENSYGASNILEAPNNQYILEYNTEEEKNNALKELEKSKDTLYVEENHIYTLLESDYNSWGIEKTGLDSAIKTAEEEYDGMLKNITVAIIDSGCDMELFNQSYSGKIKESYNLFDGSVEMYDTHGHGTHIAGTIAEGTSSNINILPVKVSNSKTMDVATVVAAVNYINYYKKADVINMSFGGTEFSNSLYVAIEAAAKNGIISVAAAGNESTSATSYPAGYENTISVSAVDSELKFADFSNYGQTITFAAPGVAIKSINGTMSGTSMATPHVASAVSMLKSVNKSLSLEQTTALLKSTAIDLGTQGWDKYYGYGLINLADFDDLIEETEKTNIVDFEIDNTTKIEAIYGNITNLMSLKITLKDANGNEYDKYLSDLEDIEIENYDAFKTVEQKIKIKYNNIEKTITVQNNKCDTSAYTCTYIDSTNSNIAISNIVINCKKIYIPEYINGCKVVALADALFRNKKIDEIILPSTVSSIGDNAFYNSTIKSITGGANEVALGTNVFYNAYRLEEFEPEISALGQGAFYTASSIKNITLSDNIKILPGYAFCNCVNLENINIPNNLIQIQEGALANTNIKNINIPKTLVNIGENAFYWMNGLETITVDADNPIYDSREKCNALIETSSNTIIVGSSSTTIPDTVLTIGNTAFYKNKKLEKINTNKVKTIKNNAFEGCSNLKEFYLTDTVTTLGYHALYDVPKVTVYMYNTKFQSDLYNGNQKVERAICIIPKSVTISASEKYKAFTKPDDIKIDLSYYGFGYGFSLGEFSLSETITEGYNITYENGGDYFKTSDTYFIVSATTKYGIEIEEKVNVTIEDGIPEYVAPTISKIYNDDNTVTVKVESQYPFEDTKPTWKLSEDKMTYTKTYNTNGIYSTVFKDIYNEPKTLTFEIDEIISKYNIIKKYDTNTNTVAVNVINNYGMQNTKPTWILSADAKIYTKTYNENGTYTTKFVDSKGAEKSLTITINEIDDKAPEITIKQKYNSETNTVTVEAISNETFGQTKPTWVLSADAIIYTKTYNTNGTYTTKFEDIYGNSSLVTFTVNEIQSKYKIDKTYDVTTNTVKVTVTNNYRMQATKPTWQLSENQTIYSKIYNLNGEYTTKFVDADGKETSLTFTIEEIDDVEPNLTTKIKYNEETNTVTVEVTSDEILGQTKPTWVLSADKKVYSKIYNTNGIYTTTFKDIHGNSTSLTFEINKIQSKYEIIQTYDETTNTTTVTVINNYGMQAIKPTWSLSEDKTTYTKIYNAKGTYTTKFVDIDGNETSLKFTI